MSKALSQSTIDIHMRTWMGSNEADYSTDCYESMIFRDIMDIILEYTESNRDELEHNSRFMTDVLRTVIAVDKKNKHVLLSTGCKELEKKIRHYVYETTYELRDEEYPKVIGLKKILVNDIIL